MSNKIFLTHSSLIDETHRERLAAEIDYKCCDKVHTTVNFNGQLTNEILRKLRRWRHSTFAHLLLHCIIWKKPENMSDCKRGDELIAILTQDFDYISQIIRNLEKYKEWFNVQDVRTINLIVQVSTNAPYYDEAVVILQEFFVRYLSEESHRRNLYWCVNQMGYLHENSPTYHLTVHITSNSLYTGIRIADYNFFYPFLSQTSQYGSSSMAVAQAARIKDGSVVLDLNAVVGELLLEVMFLKNCYCIGLVQALDDAEGALRNFDKFLRWKSGGKPFLDLICADMKEFFNFFAVDHMLARCPFRPNRPIFEAQAYFNKLDAVLKRCRPSITVTVIYPKASEYVTIVRDMFIKQPHVRIVKSCFFEEFHRKYGLIQFQTGVFDRTNETPSPQ